MIFKATFCDPFQPDILQLGTIEKDKIISTFETITWDDFLNRMKNADRDKLYYSPSLEIENIENKNGLSISAVDGTEWYIFYKRPKQIQKRKWFKKVDYLENDYLSDLENQTRDDAIICLQALINNDLKFLEAKFGD